MIVTPYFESPNSDHNPPDCDFDHDSDPYSSSCLLTLNPILIPFHTANPDSIVAGCWILILTLAQCWLLVLNPDFCVPLAPCSFLCTAGFCVLTLTLTG
jgi:hypothetical protein